MMILSERSPLFPSKGELLDCSRYEFDGFVVELDNGGRTALVEGQSMLFGPILSAVQK